MKKSLCLLLLILFLVDSSFLPVFSSDIQKNDYVSYNLSEQQKIFVKNISRSDNNLKTAEKLIELNLLDDCINSLKNEFGSNYYSAQLYLIVKANPDKLTPKELKKIDKDFGSDYIIQIDNNFFNGISKINLKEDYANSTVNIYDKYFFQNIKTLKKYLEIQQKYSLSERTMRNIMHDTNNLSRRMKTLQQALDDGLYEKFTTYCHNKSSAVYYHDFPERYEAVKKIESSKYLTETQKMSAYKNRYNLIQADGKYYKNLYKIEDFSDVKNIEFYSKTKYKNTKNIRKYKEFQKEYNLDVSTMDNVWADSNRLKNNQKIITKAINDKTYFDYNNLKYNGRTSNKKYMEYGWQNTKFKENYRSYIYLNKHSNFEEKQIRSIILKDGEPDVAINPFYWGNKEQKIKKTLKKNNMTKKEQYEQILERLYYRRPTTQEWVNDISLKSLITVLLLSGIGTIGGIMALAAYSDSGGTFIKIVW